MNRMEKTYDSESQIRCNDNNQFTVVKLFEGPSRNGEEYYTFLTDSKRCKMPGRYFIDNHYNIMVSQML